jgi:hypothetical protein
MKTISLAIPLADPASRVPGAAAGRIGALARAVTAETAWAQWVALTAVGAERGERPAASTVDPEALVLASLGVRAHEPRLRDAVMGMARGGTRLLSVQRMSTLADSFPAPAQEGFRAFAWAAAEAGDPRWAPHAERPAADAPAERARRLGPLRVMAGPALMLRLRTGLGVGIKADVLALLLGVHGASVPLKGMALATGYSARGIRKAAEELAAGGFVRQADESPLAFAADHRAWAGVLGLNEARAGGRAGVPSWRGWSLVYAFLAAVDEWSAEARREEWSDYVAASRARDLARDHAPRLKPARIELPDPREGGAAYLDDFARAVERLGAWCRKHL